MAGITCEHCNKHYEKVSDFEKDCFLSSDGWSWEHFHNCLKDENQMVIHGYKKEELLC